MVKKKQQQQKTNNIGIIHSSVKKVHLHQIVFQLKYYKQ